MNLLTLVDKLYGGSAVLAEPALCLRSRSQKSGCTACVDSCPVQAIRMGSMGPELDPLACKGCGLCEPVCPTGVFTLKETAGLLPKLGEGRVALLTCSAFPGADRVKAPCLAGLSAETLAAVAAGRTLLLVEPAGCAACPAGAQGRLEPVVAESSRLLAAFGLTGSVRLVRGEKAAEAELAAANQLDRRQFLDFARLGLMAAASTVVKPEQEARTLQELPAQVPQGRRHFLGAVRRQGGSRPLRVPREGLRFGLVTLEAGCDGCEACTASCPSGALRLERGKAEDRLSFAADRCVACRLCVEACPHGLLALAPEFSPTAVAASEVASLATLAVSRCSRCGQEFRGSGDWCRECGKADRFRDAILGFLAGDGR